MLENLKLLTITETAELLGISCRTLYNGCAPSSKHPFPIRPIRVGRLLRFDSRDVVDFIDKQKSGFKRR